MLVIEFGQGDELRPEIVKIQRWVLESQSQGLPYGLNEQNTWNMIERMVEKYRIRSVHAQRPSVSGGWSPHDNVPIRGVSHRRRRYRVDVPDGRRPQAGWPKTPIDHWINDPGRGISPRDFLTVDMKGGGDSKGSNRIRRLAEPAHIHIRRHLGRLPRLRRSVSGHSNVYVRHQK
ncbi:hypothetical protein VA337_11520 [Paenarthrobacter ureafaciens]|nr:hypothetical protein [Paenarthrobacter ureafaciens]MEC3852421.1 hypothetical protein [Paenarthrobacter ureafaciens]